MFFLNELTQTVYLPPVEFNSEIHKTIEYKLYKMVEGTCTGEKGFIIAVTNITEFDGGRINEKGHAIFTIKYKALLLKPVKNEVLDAIVVNVNDLGVFCEVGPLSVFVSNYHIPPAYLGYEKIQNETLIRLRIIGTHISSEKMYAIGTINEDFLGPFNA